MENTMNRKQSASFDRVWKRYRGAGGRIVVDGRAIDGSAADAMACLDSNGIDLLISEMSSLTVIMETLPDPNQYKPEDIPSRTSKSTIHIDCAEGTREVTWSK
jgi:hypothetical protein